MTTLSKSNATEHCRTCLVKININENALDAIAKAEPQCAESKDICIKIFKNSALQTFLDKYIEDERIKQNADQYPQHVCLSCFNSIQEADRFLTQARLSAETLFNLISDETEHVDVNNDVFRLLSKDSLMEPETVLLENHLQDEIEESSNPDPFNDEWDGSTGDCSGTDTDYKTSGNETTAPVKDKKPTTRSSSRKNKSEGLKVQATSPIVMQKRKRRTKQEMEQLLSQEIEKTTSNESKTNRRQKGTKNSFKCDLCKHSFAHKITLDAHVRKIHEGSTRPYHCDRCNKSYTFIGGLYTHIKEVHDKEGRAHTCDHPKCGRTYTSFIAMQKHKRLKHTEEGEQKKYVCEQCGAAFNQSCNLYYHRRSKHPTEAEQAKKADAKLYECDICNKMFHTRYTLKYHKLQLHSTEMNFECEICGIKKAKKFMLAQHMLVHSTDKMPCEHCGRQFIRKFELEAHIRTVHMKLKPFTCKYCLESFATRKTLRHHEYIHTGEKPYVCQTCGQSYRQPTCLKNHLKTHDKLSDTSKQDTSKELPTKTNCND